MTEQSARSDGVRDIKFLTVAEVASAARVSKMTIYRLIHSGELAAIRVGRGFRVPEDAAKDFLERGTQ